MCSAGLQGAVRSHQVHQLMPGTDVGCGLPNALMSQISPTPKQKHILNLLGKF